MATENCPSCGAPLEMKTRAAILVVCPYCDSTLLRQSQVLEAVGKMAELQEDGSPLQIGSTGQFRGKAFEVVGRIQLEYARGYWNEWFLSGEDSEPAWLGEGQGQYTLTRNLPGVRVPAFEELRVGMSVSVGAESFQVREVSWAKCVSCAGELPHNVTVGYDARLADLAGRERRFATLDYSETPPLVFVGENVPFDELRLRNLREFEGWA